MEAWVLALICTALVLLGIMIGAVSMFLVIRYRRRHCCSAASMTFMGRKGFGSCMRPADSVVDEELASELTPAEKQVLHKIACYNGAISLTLKLPEPSLGIPLSPAAMSSFNIRNARFSLSSADADVSTRATVHAEPLPMQHTALSSSKRNSDERSIASPSADHRQLCSNTTEYSTAFEKQQVKEQAPQYVKLDTSTEETAEEATEEAIEEATEEAIEEAIEEAADESATEEATATPDATPDTTATVKESTRHFRVLQSKPTVIQSPSKRPANISFQNTVSWSSPIDDRSRRSMASEANTASNGDRFAASECTSDEQGHSPKDALASSVVESHLDTISVNTSPASPRTLASPCNSFDYVFIPPSPSISSLYGMSAMETLSHAPPIPGNPRSVNIAKSSSSPGCVAGQQSLFSPPPVAFHQKYFESRGPRSPLVQRSASDNDAV
ncbi:hypothetical protein BX070DRAFT_235642 [Coemansia spiralis]|nr:hypothetical protein BX070DRAFT_235642 [Coemansia spiralis]